MEAGTGLEHEKGNCLLQEQSDHDSAPLDMGPVLGGRPKAELKHDKTKNGDRTVNVFRTLVQPIESVSSFKWDLSSKKKNWQWLGKTYYIFELKTKRGAQDNSEERKPAQAIADVFWESEKRVLDERNPDCFNGVCDD